MPTWCTNRVTLTGPKQEIDRFIEQAKQPFSYVEYGFSPKSKQDVPQKKHEVNPAVLSFHNFVPMPNTMHIPSPAPEEGPLAKIAKENMEKYGVSDWHAWAGKYWGTKWDAHEVIVDRINDRTVNLVFDTAWYSPEPVLEAIHEQFPKLAIKLSWNEDEGQRGRRSWKAAFIGHVDPRSGRHGSTLKTVTPREPVRKRARKP